MRSKIYYFTATGNSLAIAKKIADSLGDSELISIPQVMQSGESVQGDCIGIVCPIYMYNLPHMVIEFIGKIQKADYLFLVFSGGGSLGSGDRAAMRILSKYQLTLSALFNVPMPSNYANYGCPPVEKQNRLHADAQHKIQEIAAVVKSKKSHMDGNHTGWFKSNIFPGILYKLGHAQIHGFDKSFSVDDCCTGCGTCEKVCPSGNIQMLNGQPVWNNQCEQCYACLQWCPVEAINSRDKTKGVPRYHHPEVKVADIIASSARR